MNGTRWRKLLGLKLAQAYRRQFGVDFISVIPTNLYGRATTITPRIAMYQPPLSGDFTKPR